MIKYWVDYIASDGTCTVGYRTLVGFVTDVLDWKQSKHEDSEEKLYVYENRCKEEGFYIEQN